MRAFQMAFAMAVLHFPLHAHAQSEWKFVSDARWPNDTTSYIVQVDKASMQRTGTKVRYWLRIANSDTARWTGNDLFFDVKLGPSLYEDDCALSKLRIVQGKVIWGYDGPMIPLSRPADWQYIQPDSLAERVHAFVCKL